MKYILFALLLLTFNFALLTSVHAIYDPLSVPNNKFGIHIISATIDEASPAAQLVNSSGGDWGYVTVLMENNDKDYQKWQQFFNDLRRRHLIPLIRLATQPEGAVWKRPNPGEEQAWADFLDQLIWPTKNRYVIIYNEPNHAQEWGNQVDARDYAQALDKTITALKKKNPDFFVLNAGFDASAPHQPPEYFDQLAFMQEMNRVVPGIFHKLDGWVSHSYPNPGFMGSPLGNGRGSVRTWYWELQQLRNFGVSENLPVFITETGWKHAEGINLDKSLPSAEVLGNYFTTAFDNAWVSSRIVAVTPFLLNYQEPPFDHFSFKKLTGEKQNQKILGIQYPEYYPHYQIVQEIKKVTGRPIQEYIAQLTKGQIYNSIVVGESYTIPLTFKNTGQAIWGEYQEISLQAVSGGQQLGIAPIFLPKDQKVEPEGEYTFTINLKAPLSGIYNFSLNLYDQPQNATTFAGSKPFLNDPFEFMTEVKSPVVLKIKAALFWKDNFSGDYLLTTLGVIGEKITKVVLDNDGESDEFEVRSLIPDYTYSFTLKKPYYKPKTITQKVSAGLNTLDFGRLKPDIVSAILNPIELWKLLPWSR